MSQASEWGPDNPNWRGGKSFHPLYLIYNDMVARCQRPTHLRYADYGGRGITVCQRWLGRQGFWNFVTDMGPRPAGLTPGGRAAYTLDRRDNDGPYSPENCRWATTTQQRHNRRPQRLKARCKSGHEFTEQNTTFTVDGKRRCRTCVNRWAREAKHRRKAAA